MFDLLRRSMMSRMLAVGVVALATSGSQVSCSTGDTSKLDDAQQDSSSGANASFTTLLVLRDAAGAERYTFQRGELITFEVTVRNRTTQAGAHEYTGPTGNVHVFNNGGTSSLWNPHHGRVFAQVVQYQTLPAGETQTMRYTWNQVLPDGSNLPVGTYEAQGSLTGMVFLGAARTRVDEDDLVSTLRQFTIQ
jgi:hypothetical protein